MWSLHSVHNSPYLEYTSRAQLLISTNKVQWDKYCYRCETKMQDHIKIILTAMEANYLSALMTVRFKLLARQWFPQFYLQFQILTIAELIKRVKSANSYSLHWYLFSFTTSLIVESIPLLIHLEWDGLWSLAESEYWVTWSECQNAYPTKERTK